MSRRGLLLVAAVLLSLWPTAAHAREATSEEVATLAEAAAAGDDTALAELRTVDSVDGRPVDLGAALEASRDELDSRLEVLGRAGAGPETEGARESAREILAQRRFNEPDLPQPFRRPLEIVADRLRDVGGWLSSVFDAIPGEGNITWVLLAIVVAAVSTWVATRLARRRARVRAEHPLLRLAEEGLDPRELEARAESAEASGDYEQALRLRFAAGLRRLDERHTITFTPSLTSGDVARQLGSPDFDRVAAIFDEVVYGRRPATDSDVAETRSRWGNVLAGSPKRKVHS